MKTDKVLKLLKPFLALALVLVVIELAFLVTNNFGLVVPYRDHFFNKGQRVSHVKGAPWTKFEYENTVYRDKRMQHVAPFPDFANAKGKRVFLLGDSMVESGSTSVDKSFYALADQRSDLYNIAAYHAAGASLKKLNYFFQRLTRAIFTVDKKFYKPDLVVLQLRPFSYQGAPTFLPDPKTGKRRNIQEKLPSQKKVS